MKSVREGGIGWMGGCNALTVWLHMTKVVGRTGPTDRPCKGAQTGLIWTDKTCHACTQLIMSQKAQILLLLLFSMCVLVLCTAQDASWPVHKRRVGLTLPWRCVRLRPSKNTIMVWSGITLCHTMVVFWGGLRRTRLHGSNVKPNLLLC